MFLYGFYGLLMTTTQSTGSDIRTFRIDIPLSKAIQSMLLAETGVQTVAFPDRMVAECVVAQTSDVQSVNGQRSILIHDRFLPLFLLVDLSFFGANAAKVAAGLGANVAILDINLDRLRYLDDVMPRNVTTLFSDFADADLHTISGLIFLARRQTEGAWISFLQATDGLTYDSNITMRAADEKAAEGTDETEAGEDSPEA